VPLDVVAAASPEAQRRYPFLDPSMTLEDLTVVGDGGEVWVGAKAWVVKPFQPPQLLAAVEKLVLP